MATEVLMPKLGLTMTEGTIEEWKFKEGDTVKKGDILFSVATDKLTNDVEAEEDGVLLKILLPEGETSWMMTTLPSAGAVILRLSPAGLRLGSRKKQMKNTAKPAGMQKSIQYRTLGAPKYHDVPPRSTANTSAISIVTAPSLCIFMTF